MAEQLSGHDLLYLLVRKFLAGDTDVSVFCADFENSYNFHTEKAALTAVEARAFKDVFDKVVWYSPFPEERKMVPSYLGEAEIKHIVLEAAARLGVPQSS
jgi:hypothetical protein